MAIKKFRAGRVSSADASTWIGEPGTMFYDEATGQLKIADGVTPGGSYIPLVIATPTVAGAIKAGPGANVAVDGTLTIDTAGLPLSIGNLSIIGANISTVGTDENLNLISNGSGEINVVGNFHVHTVEQGPNSASPIFSVVSDGQVRMIIPSVDSIAGAAQIIGNADSSFVVPNNTGVMFHVTGQLNDPGRIYNDGQGAYAAYIGRRYNGTSVSPSQVLANQMISRVGATPYTNTGWPTISTARIDFVASQNQTTTALGSRIEFWATANNSSTITKVATIDADNGVTTIGNLTVSGRILPIDGNDIGISTHRWGNIWLGPTAIHMQDTVTMDDVALQVTNGTLYLNGAENIALGNLVIQNATLKTITPDLDINIGELPDTGNVNVYRPIYVYDTGGNVRFNTDRNGFVTIHAPTVTTTNAGLMIIGSTSGNIQPAGGTSTGRMVHITGNDGASARFTMDAFGTGAFASYIGRAARGTADSPTALQAGDVMMRFSATGWAEPGYNTTNTGGPPTSIDFVATDNYTHSVYGSAIKFYTSPQGSIGRNLSLTVDTTGITANSLTSNTASIVGNVTAGNVNAKVYGELHGTLFRPIRNAGVIADGGTLTIDFSTDAIVYCTWANGMNLAYSNYTAGRIVKVMCTKASGSGTDSIGLDGITAAQVSSGSTSITAAADTTTFIELVCTNGTIGGLFAKV